MDEKEGKMEQSRSKARRIAIQKGETFPEMDIKEFEELYKMAFPEFYNFKPLPHLAHIEGARWGFLILLPRIKELEEKLNLRESILCPECLQTLEPDGSCFTCRVVKRVKELEGVNLELKEEIEKHIKPGSYISSYGTVYPSHHMALAKLVKKV